MHLHPQPIAFALRAHVPQRQSVVASVPVQENVRPLTAATNPFAWDNCQIGGGQANQSAAYLDGGPVNVSSINLTALVPTQDSI